jgi:hypothetical protein
VLTIINLSLFLFAVSVAVGASPAFWASFARKDVREVKEVMGVGVACAAGCPLDGTSLTFTVSVD